MTEAALVVIAKAPVPGRSKTRLSPPCSPAEAADLAGAALDDTLSAVARTPVARKLLALEGDLPGDAPARMEVVPQRGYGLGERLADALLAAGGPALVIAMDTPQVTPELLAGAVRRLSDPGVDAVLGPSQDGGYWAIGARNPDPALFWGVPMSSSRTLEAQRRRLDQLGVRWAELPTLRDVDTMADAHTVAAESPGTRFARVLAGLGHSGPSMNRAAGVS
ncbi:MAG: TIGR04282 family arsenosugar biosynthesis glycosyltransferase [Thermoleophilaceae bacterium]